MTKVLYHANCNDGFCAAWVARKRHPNAEFIPVNYGEKVPENLSGCDVYVLDFSYPREVLIPLARSCSGIVVLDHHKTAEAELRDLPFCIFDMDKSGCRLAWEHFFGWATVPWLVEYCEDRDLWRHELPQSHEVNAWISSWPRTFEVWDGFPESVTNEMVAGGTSILRFRDQLVDQALEHRCKMVIAGHEVEVVHTTVFFSEVAGKLAETNAFGATWYATEDGKYKFSLRSRGDFDVSAVAKAYGGGGHKNAAGFTVGVLPDRRSP
jgi:oligoribonuclease NrnB/cAMP/cGMP phosphodiesterase (DHH superfamily)